MSRRALVATIVVLALAGGAVAGAVAVFSSDDGNGGVATETTLPDATTSTPTTGAPTTTPGCPPAGGTAPFDSGTGSGTALLTGVSVTATGDCTDTVRFTFRGDVQPGVRVSYQEPPFTQDASGEPVDVAGTAFVVVRFEPAATADQTVDPIVRTYTGPDVVTPTDATFVQEVHETGDFEAVLTWVIGLRERRGFSVTVAAGSATITFT
jgi:hypothetical protein